MPLMFKQALERLTSEKAPGPLPTFSVFHLLAALELIAAKPIGRNRLAENLNVGEGVIRTVISRLKDAGLVRVSKIGCSLSNKGIQLWKEYSAVFRKVEIGKSELALKDHNFVVLVKDHGHQVASGMEQRDAAIRMGAKSVTTMVCKNGRLVIPSVSNDVAKCFPIAAKQIAKVLKPEENDVIVIASADNDKMAEHGALAAAWTLVTDS
jgi:predicted transcriptional regulator